MIIKEPHVESLYERDHKLHLIECARRTEMGLAYKDKDLYGLTADDYYDSTVTQHQTYYYIISKQVVPDWVMRYHRSFVGASRLDGIVIYYTSLSYLVIATGYWVLHHPTLVRGIKTYEVRAEKFWEHCGIAKSLSRFTFAIKTQFSTMVKLNNIHPRPLNYRLYTDSIVRPYWMDRNKMTITKDDKEYGFQTAYSFPIQVYQDADVSKMIPPTGILPMDTCVMWVATYAHEEWVDIIEESVSVEGNEKPIVDAIQKIFIEDLGYSDL